MAADTINNPPFLVGIGYDVHRFNHVPNHNTSIAICGLNIPSNQIKVEAHSDGDVGIHAVVDAMLGAIADGDIGQHFPPSDPKWKNKESSHFLLHARKLVEERQYRVINIDITIICEHPKINPHRQEMRKKMSELLGIPVNYVSVKATTTEKLGFAGRKEGIAAQAVCLLGL